MMAIIVLASLAAFVHVLFFLFESVLWTKPAVRKIFAQSEAEAHTTKLLAFNQGFYNLFLAASTFVGLYFLHDVALSPAIGTAILTVSLGSMVGAALVLLFSAGFKMLRGALLQGLAPAICLVLLWRPL